MQGYNGSQLWDTAFAVQVCEEMDRTKTWLKWVQTPSLFLYQAMVSTGLIDVASNCLTKAHSYVHNTQVRPCSPHNIL